jgi:hypothetical protein
MIALAVSVVLYVLVAGPVLAAFFYAIKREEPDAHERAAADVQRFIELRERAHAELAATGSLEHFAAVKDEARKHLWPPRSERAHPSEVSPPSPSSARASSGGRTSEHLVPVGPGRSAVATIEARTNGRRNSP